MAPTLSATPVNSLPPSPPPDTAGDEEAPSSAPRGRLPREECEDLCARAQEGDGRALSRVVGAHLRLVRKLARRYLRSGVQLEDLVNEGNIGLVRAVRKFDARHGLPFIPYAVWWIKQSMIMFLIQHGQGSISLPIRKVQLMKRLRREEDTLKSLLGRSPDAEELAERLDQPVSKVREVRNLLPEYVSWEDYLRNDSVTTGAEEEAHPAEVRVDQDRLRGRLEQLVRNLPRRDQRGVRLYFGLDGGHGMNFADLGRTLDMTREGARQMIKRSLRRMRADPGSRPLRSFL